MKRYIAGGGAIVAVTLFFTLLIPSDALGYIRHGDKTALPAGCGAKLKTAIQSVYPGAPIEDTQSWYCRRTLDDETNPLGAHCYGTYDLTMSGDAWHAATAADGMGAWPALSVDEAADTVRVRRRTPGFDLDAAQRVAHALLFDGCVLDDLGDPLAWGEIVEVKFSRDPKLGIEVKPVYLASEAKGSTIAKLQIEGKVSKTVVVE